MRGPTKASEKVWDPLVRIVHWGLVASVCVAWLVTDGRVHDTAGYAALALVAIRVAWGFVGSGHARFASFIVSPRSALDYANEVAAGAEPRYIGHNPLGGWMILALLGTAAATSLSGWLYTTDAFWGVAWVEQLHAAFAYLLLALAVLHVAGVIFTSTRQRENLVVAMFHGRKRSPDKAG
jgi:cytochrome b